MAKKQKRTVKKKKARAAPREGEEPEPEQFEEQEIEIAHPGIPRVMVTWHGTGSSERESKNWHGIEFEAGKPQAVEHSPFWNQMRNAIDNARDGIWTYTHVVEQPAPEPPPPEPEVDPETTSRSRRR